MNFCVICGRLTKDPEVRATQEGMLIARYTVAVDRPGKKDKADFFDCKAFGKSAEFAEKYLRKGMKILIDGSMQQGSYTTKDGKLVYYWELIVNHHEFCEGKKEPEPKQESFVDIPDDIGEELPFTF